jgi:integrase
MARGRMPKLCRHRGTGRAYVTDPATGREVYLGRWGTEEARRKYRLWLQAFLARAPADREAGGLPGPRATVSQLLLSYLQYARKRYVKHGKPTSEVAFFEVVARELRAHFADLPADSLRAWHLEELQQKLAAKHWNRETINRLCTKTRAAWKWALARGIVTGACYDSLRAAGPLLRGRSEAVEPEEVQPVPLALVEQTLPLVPPHVRQLVQLQLHGGMRPGEACALRPCEVDTSSVPWCYRPGSWKTEHRSRRKGGKEVWLGPQAREVLAPLLAAAGDPQEPLFRGRFGGSYGAAAYAASIRRALRKAGLPHWHPNQLRHTQGTRVRQKYGLEGTQAVLGHEHADTSEIYAQADRDLARRIAEDLG